MNGQIWLGNRNRARQDIGYDCLPSFRYQQEVLTTVLFYSVSNSRSMQSPKTDKGGDSLGGRGGVFGRLARFNL